jgi:predicted nucleotidyltransferase
MKPTHVQSHLRYPLNALLTTERYVRVLRVLFRHSGALGTTRIARDAGLSRHGAREALASLADQGVILVTGSDKSINYKANPHHPLAAALSHLFDMERQREDAILDAVKTAVDGPDIAGAWIFGSFARGEDGVDSDLDIAIATPTRDPDTADRVRERLDAASEQLNFSPSVVSFDFADVARMSTGDPWWRNLVREAIVVKGGRPESLPGAVKATAHG